MSVKFIRIDDRLIHGQIVTAWMKVFQTRRVVIIDDIVAADDFLKNVMFMVKPAGVELEIIGTENLDAVMEELEADSANVMILIKTPASAKACFDHGLKTESLNVGGMGAKVGRKQLYRNVSASEEEMEVLRELKARGIDVYLQATPNDKKIPIETVK